jgi:hypothetical protein
MADEVKMSFAALEKAWIKQSIAVQIKALMRSRQKEIAGGEVWALRGKELDFLNALAARF